MYMNVLIAILFCRRTRVPKARRTEKKRRRNPRKKFHSKQLFAMQQRILNGCKEPLLSSSHLHSKVYANEIDVCLGLTVDFQLVGKLAKGDLLNMAMPELKKDEGLKKVFKKVSPFAATLIKVLHRFSSIR